MMLVCIGLIIVSLILLFIYEHIEKDWICDLAVILDIIGLIIAFFGLAGAINRDKLNNKQKEVTDMKTYYIYFTEVSPENEYHNSYATIYANNLWSALGEFEDRYGSVDTVYEIDVE